MAFTPVIPNGGLAGWSFLQRTLDRQEDIFSKSPDIKRDIEYFKNNIQNVETLDDLMQDRKILKVALGAFGLGEEISKGAFVRKILDEGVTEQRSFARRLNNPDYIEMAKTFNFEGGQLSLSETDINRIAAQYERQNFEIEVGNVDDSMRLALNFQREIQDLAGAGLSENAGWFRLLGSVPMRTVIEGAFNLPTEFAALDIDKQKEILSDKAQSKFGGKSIDVFTDPDVVDRVINDFLLRKQIEAGPSTSTPGFAALSILGQSNSGVGSSGLFNLLLSNG
ncbi:DUF1217 domain-containing protein [Litorimonas sp.]|uniref:DUF1217 domain-containing protein n=1 Tax=Litorimonas sp. TaxID=1892381 RepID=UPI003A8B8C99